METVLGGAGSGSLSMDDGERQAGSSHLSVRHNQTGTAAIRWATLLLSDLRLSTEGARGLRRAKTLAAHLLRRGKCFMVTTVRSPQTGGWLRSHVRRGAVSQRGAPFNSDRVFMACVADKAADRRNISALWAVAVKFTSP